MLLIAPYRKPLSLFIGLAKQNGRSSFLILQKAALSVFIGQAKQNGRSSFLILQKAALSVYRPGQTERPYCSAHQERHRSPSQLCCQAIRRPQ